MFKFDLPAGAALHVFLPTGGETILVHAGEGRFLSKVPPIALAGLAREGEGVGAIGLPVSWDGQTLPGDGPTQPIWFGFDVNAAADAVKAASEGGDTFARAVMAEIEAAQRTLDAREALGVMTPAAAPVGACGKVCGDCGQEACGVAGKEA